MFSYQFYEISKNNSFAKNLWKAASETRFVS